MFAFMVENLVSVQLVMSDRQECNLWLQFLSKEKMDA